jgi:pimeloyl-ACP methyl ester carboxylesterase
MERFAGPVVFLHGVTDSWRSFERVLPLLSPDVRAFALWAFKVKASATESSRIAH